MKMGANPVNDVTERLERLAARAQTPVSREFYRSVKAEIERLRDGFKEYACTGSDHPCGCYAEFVRDSAEIERLQAEKAELLKQRSAEEMQLMIDYWGKRAEKAEAEIERLQKELDEACELGAEAMQQRDAATAQVERLRATASPAAPFGRLGGDAFLGTTRGSGG